MISLDPKELHLIEGDSSQINTMTVPSGVDLAWSSSDETVATVDGNGLVTAVSEGNATITASFEYEGTVYSDSSNVTVEPNWEVVREFTSEEIWNDDSLWNMKNYIYPDPNPDVIRETSVYWISNQLDLHYSKNYTEVTTLYADLRPTIESVELDSNYDYALKIWRNNPIQTESEPILSLSSTLGNKIVPDGWSEVALTHTEQGSASDFYLPVIINETGNSNLFILKIKKDVPRTSPYVMFVRVTLVRKPK